MPWVEAHAGVARRQRDTLLEQELELAFPAPGFDDAIATGIADLDDLDRDTLLVEQDKLGPHANLRPAAVQGCSRGIFDIDPLAAEQDGAVTDLARQYIHAGRADEMSDKGVTRTFEEFDG